MDNTQEQLGILCGDISATLLGICNALELKGVISKAEIAESLQERLLRLKVDQQQPLEHFPLLFAFALELTKTGE